MSELKTEGTSVNEKFIDSSESVIAAIGSNYLQNYLSGGNVSKGIGILTQKRFYYKGKNFSGNGLKVHSSTDETIVSIDDITVTQFTHINAIGYLIAAILLLPPLIYCLYWMMSDGVNNRLLISNVLLAALFIFCSISYFVKRKTLFTISFPGGKFGFNCRWYSISEIQNFQRQIHLHKDNAKKESK